MGKKFEKSELTKKRIATVAIQLFRTRGYTDITVDDIVEAAGIAHGSFYLYYKSKADILGEYLLEIENQYYANHKQNSSETDENAPTPLEQICKFLIDVNRIMTDSGKDLLKMYNAYIIRDMHILDVHNRHYFQYLEELIENARAADLIRPSMSNEHILTIAVALTRGISMEWAVDQKWVDVSLNDRYFQEFCKYIAKP